jgi:flagellar hook-length control protein FliK
MSTSLNARVQAIFESILAQTFSQISDTAMTLQPRETRSLRLRLNPEELGQIEIAISHAANGRVSARIEAQTDEARHALGQNLGSLRSALENAGVSIDRIEVTSGFHSGTTSGGVAGDERRNQQSSLNQASASISDEVSSDSAAVQDERLLSVRV